MIKVLEKKMLAIDRLDALTLDSLGTWHSKSFLSGGGMVD